ncbi:MAG: nucleotidyltransferase, partial [Spirochaeta sp. LUC14_002_19_P3]
MAAGMGSRYGGIKQIDPMGPNKEILLDYSVYDAVKAGFDKLVFIIRRDIEAAFRQSIGDKFNGKISINYAFQELDNLPAGFTAPPEREKPWGTAHAILSCKNLISEPFIVINADDFYGFTAYQEAAKGLEKLNSNRLEGFLIGYMLRNTLSPHGTVSRGVCESSNGYLHKITERLQIRCNANGTIEYLENEKIQPLSGQELVSMNFWGFTPELFEALEEGFIQFLSQYSRELKSEYLIPSVVDKLIST